MYIGRGIDQIDNISTLDNLSFNGSLQTFNLTQNSVAFVPVSADALQIQIDGVIQSGNYTVSGSTVTFDFTPSGSSVCNGIKHFGVGLLTTVSDNSITTAKLGADAVDGTKIADDSISDEHLDITAITGQTAITSLADTDKFLVSDASDSGNLKYVEKQYLPSGTHVQIAQSEFTNSTDVSFTSIQQSTYNNYFVRIESLYASADNTSLYGRIYLSSGEITSSLYDYAVREYRSDNNFGSTQNQNGAFMRFNHRSIDNNAAHPFFANIYIGGVKSGQRCQYFGQSGFSSADSDNPSTGGYFSSHYTSSQEITGFKFYPDANNITGKITLFGIIT